MERYFVHYKQTVMSAHTTSYDYEVVVANTPKDAEERLLKSKLHELNDGHNICRIWRDTLFATDMNGNAVTFEITKTEEAW